MTKNQADISFHYNRRFLQLFLGLALIGVIVLSVSYYQAEKPGAGSGLVFGIALFVFFRKHVVVRLYAKTIEYQVTPMGTKHVIDYQNIIGMAANTKTIKLSLDSGETTLNIPLNLINAEERENLIRVLKQRTDKSLNQHLPIHS
jgi:hypothetical protein